MATKLKTYPYAIYRTDGSYLIHDLTQADYKELVTTAHVHHDGFITFAEVSIGLIRIDDVRAIIKQNEVPVATQEEKAALPVMTLEEKVWHSEALKGLHDDEEVDFQ